MTNTESLKSLESLLENFLGKVIEKKENKLLVLEGINSLDDISQLSSDGIDVVDEVGNWFAKHNRWLTEQTLKDSELNRITGMLSGIKNEFEKDNKKTPAKRKIEKEINRWSDLPTQKPSKITLKRPSETVNKTELRPDSADTISLFLSKLSKLTTVFMDHTGSKQHILTVLDELLLSSSTQKNKDALILSAFIIYYLKQNGYKVEPYVKKLKEAETLYKRGLF